MIAQRQCVEQRGAECLDAAPPKSPGPRAAARRHLFLIHPGCLSKPGWNIHPRARKRPLRSLSSWAKGGTCGAQHYGMLSTSTARSAPQELRRAGVPIAALSREPAFGKRKGERLARLRQAAPTGSEGGEKSSLKEKKKREKKTWRYFCFLERLQSNTADSSRAGAQLPDWRCGRPGNAKRTAVGKRCSSRKGRDGKDKKERKG